MKFSTDIPAGRLVAVPEPGERLTISLAGQIAWAVWVISAVPDGDVVHLEVDAPDSEVWQHGQPVPPSPRHLTHYAPPKPTPKPQGEEKPTPPPDTIAHLGRAARAEPEGPPLRFAVAVPADTWPTTPEPGEKVLLVDDYGNGHAVLVVDVEPDGDSLRLVGELEDSGFHQWGEAIVRARRGVKYYLLENGLVLTGMAFIAGVQPRDEGAA